MFAAVYVPIWVIPTVVFATIEGYLLWDDARGRRRRRRRRERLRSFR